MKKYIGNHSKFICLVLSVVFLSLSHQTFAAGEQENKINKNTKTKVLEKQQFMLIKTDSLKTHRKEVVQKKDTVSSSERSSTNSGASYNILFQVIYRNSFSEIFEEKK